MKRFALLLMITLALVAQLALAAHAQDDYWTMANNGPIKLNMDPIPSDTCTRAGGVVVDQQTNSPTTKKCVVPYNNTDNPFNNRIVL